MAVYARVEALRLRVAGWSPVARARPSSEALADLAPWIGLVGGVLWLTAVAVAAAGAPADAAFGRGLLECLIVGVPIAAGVYVLRAQVSARFGIALVGIGFAWSLTALAESSSSVPYTIGRLSVWLVFPGVVYLLLAFPDGRIAARLDRRLLVGVVVLALVLYMGTAPLVQEFPVHTPWATCTSDCPANAVAVMDRPPGWLPNLILVREWLVELLWVGLVVSMVRRWRGGSALRRRTLAPVFACALLMGLCHCAFLSARQLGAPAQTVETLGSAWTICIVATCVALFFGLFWRRTLLAGATAQLSVALRATDAPAAVRDVLATTLGDPTMQLLSREPGSSNWHDASGRRVEWPRPLAAGRAATAVGGDGGSPDVVLIHDIALCDDPDLLDAVGGMVLAGEFQEQLRSELGAAISDLQESRRRIAEAADLERARVERDLHDGAQQRLIALRVRLSLAEERLVSDPAAALRDIRALGFEADLALEELRALAHGVYPSLLTDRGVADALRSIAQQTSTPVHVTANGLTRQPIEIESAVYFTCLEAIQNAMKHAAGASAITVVLSESDSALRFEVRDDGPGFRPGTCDGRGLRNMRDRIEAIGGELTVDTRPGHGVCVRGSLTVPAQPSVA
jgi:signal transduction histidine kinase